MDTTVLKFINNFHHNNSQVVENFLLGNCYWFAKILAERFNPIGIIMYDDILNHFGCRIGNHIYDISGDVSDNYNWKEWESFRLIDPLHTLTIERDCILKAN